VSIPRARHSGSEPQDQESPGCQNRLIGIRVLDSPRQTPVSKRAVCPGVSLLSAPPTPASYTGRRPRILDAQPGKDARSDPSESPGRGGRAALSICKGITQDVSALQSEAPKVCCPASSVSHEATLPLEYFPDPRLPLREKACGRDQGLMINRHDTGSVYFFRVAISIWIGLHLAARVLVLAVPRISKHGDGSKRGYPGSSSPSKLIYLNSRPLGPIWQRRRPVNVPSRGQQTQAATKPVTMDQSNHHRCSTCRAIHETGQKVISRQNRRPGGRDTSVVTVVEFPQRAW
jgi:hypothetical protein